MSKIEKQLEELVEWLKKYYKSNEKEKMLIEIEIMKENPSMFKFLQKIKKYNKEEQEKLYKEIRGEV